MRFLSCFIFLIISHLTSFSQLVSYSDSSGKIEITTASGQKSGYIFTEVSQFNEGLAWVNKGEWYAFIDSNLNEITPYIYTDVQSFCNHFAMVSRDSTFGFINKFGNEICDLKYERVKNFSQGFATVKCGKLWGLIDTSGTQIISNQFDFPLFVINPNFILATKNGKWGVINYLGTVQFDFKYDYIDQKGNAYLNKKQIKLGL